MFSKHPQGVTLSLRVQPRSSKSGPLGAYGEKGEWLKWGLHSAPEGGKANKELIEGVARFFNLSKSRVRILQGESSRQKVVLLEGMELAEVEGRLG